MHYCQKKSIYQIYVFLWYITHREKNNKNNLLQSRILSVSSSSCLLRRLASLILSSFWNPFLQKKHPNTNQFTSHFLVTLYYHFLVILNYHFWETNKHMPADLKERSFLRVNNPVSTRGKTEQAKGDLASTSWKHVY